MKCPYCENTDTKVIDSRPTEDGRAIRRRRECERCGRRFTTYEKVEESIIMVVKKDGRREAFDRSKMMNGIIKACEKRPVAMDDIEKIVGEIERGLNNLMEKEVKSSFIGELIMDKLKDVDQVAYVRFASVYRPKALIISWTTVSVVPPAGPTTTLFPRRSSMQEMALPFRTAICHTVGLIFKMISISISTGSSAKVSNPLVAE